MTTSYEAHPIEHAGEPNLTVKFTMPDGLTTSEQRRMFDEVADEVARRERVAGVMPLTSVVFSTCQQDAERY